MTPATEKVKKWILVEHLYRTLEEGGYVSWHFVWFHFQVMFLKNRQIGRHGSPTYPVK